MVRWVGLATGLGIANLSREQFLLSRMHACPGRCAIFVCSLPPTRNARSRQRRSASTRHNRAFHSIFASSRAGLGVAAFQPRQGTSCSRHQPATATTGVASTCCARTQTATRSRPGSYSHGLRWRHHRGTDADDDAVHAGAGARHALSSNPNLAVRIVEGYSAATDGAKCDRANWISQIVPATAGLTRAQEPAVSSERRRCWSERQYCFFTGMGKPVKLGRR